MKRFLPCAREERSFLSVRRRESWLCAWEGSWMGMAAPLSMYAAGYIFETSLPVKSTMPSGLPRRIASKPTVDTSVRTTSDWRMTSKRLPCLDTVAFGCPEMDEYTDRSSEGCGRMRR